MGKHFDQLTKTDRLKIEVMRNKGGTAWEISKSLGVHISTIYRELSRGKSERKKSDWTYEECYSADIAESRYQMNLSAKGAQLKIGNDYQLAEYLEDKIINDRYSPAAALADIDRQGLTFRTKVCFKSLYNYIDKGIFLNLTNKNLPVKANKKRKYRHIQPKRPPKGESIEKRPKEINNRTTFGHWEMDTLKGKKGSKDTLLVITERRARQEIKIRMPDNTAGSVVKALDTLELKYGKMFSKVFKSITVDNGSEFADVEGMEKSLSNKTKRTKIYCCHPYSSWERGSNENQNKLIRRWIPKGTPIENYTDAQLQAIEDWMNNYPRKLLGWKSAPETFTQYLKKIA
jgi:IS30 family transposase